ncbi:uncharacterized protein LACBIDRAFT_327996 [Laccaria bicolor S238N-H82]|uniref:Predicted protein n=1 Tax=Laccaria bicolor (strain S238N-H82 / ATCC MYA-4686) TaxID=486041 RepID=B0DDH8_LACBS|nr:uncharacterized protein LACBIDRAFT_327996 [Laccaria bicolor S238N-H82]EDR07477.1 predicted protein [Laccaria bicolor S238N-H82]|eukprot:XP_001881869.1 predicted protein [Laccaria bicolor S238N-H82]
MYLRSTNSELANAIHSNHIRQIFHSLIDLWQDRLTLPSLINEFSMKVIVNQVYAKVKHEFTGTHRFFLPGSQVYDERTTTLSNNPGFVKWKQDMRARHRVTTPRRSIHRPHLLKVVYGVRATHSDGFKTKVHALFY